MGESSVDWDVAQKREQHYYETRASSHREKDQVYAEFHAPLWQGILDRLSEVEFHDGGVYVDVGCGPNPIVAFADKGTRIGIDPLMDFYKENFVLPPDFQPYKGTIEDLEPVRDGQADVIFSMNNIDHIKSLPIALETLHRKLKPDGFLVVSVNIGGNWFTASMARIFDIYRLVDPTHTYHFHSPQEFEDSMSSHFESIRHECVDDLATQMEKIKRENDTQAKTTRGMIRNALKYVKNDVILCEKPYLFLLTPKKNVPA